jgi:hypothetical protein
MTAAKASDAKVSRIPAHAPRPQDRQPRKTPAKKAPAKKTAAATARQAEAADGFVAVDLPCGFTVQIPVGEKMPLDAFLVLNGDEEALSRLKIRPEDAETAGLRLMIGADQWSAFVAQQPTLGDFAELGRQLEALTGN